jgi:pyruvate kinase
MRRTKIVATLGPATEGADAIGAVLDAGADVVRLNGAHGTPEWHERTARRARAAAEAAGRDVGILVDLPGPKLRIGAVPGDEIELRAGDAFGLTAAVAPPRGRGDDLSVTTNVPDLAALVRVGDPVWLADGEIVLTVKQCDKAAGHVVTEVVRGGTLRSGKGMVLPGADDVLEAFTAADREILELALRVGADLVGVSFVRAAADLARVRAEIGERIGERPSPPLLVAKIETRHAVDRLEEIVAAADVVMVARGDLGVQIDVARTPLVQKEIIAVCNRVGRPVVTATQMLESMTHAPLPTRAEATDVANAVLDGTDALMLSEETGVGARPAEAVATMARLAEAAESWDADAQRAGHDRPDAARAEGDDAADVVPAAVAHAAVQAAITAAAAAIVCCTSTGATARRIAALRPGAAVVAVTPDPDVAAQLAVVWGVRTVVAAESGTDPSTTVGAAQAAGAVAGGARVVVVAARATAPDQPASVHVVTAPSP